jgi:hypothetical protein
VPRDPDSPESPTPRPGAAGHASSSPGSSTPNGRADGPFVAGPGPGFSRADTPPSPDEPGSQPGSEPDLAGFAPEVSEDQIRGVLLNAGDGLHAVVGVGDLDWVMTETDLERIAPPLTRIVNRYPALAAVAGHSDEVAVSIGAGLWTWRSLLERRAVLRARESDEPAAPLSGPATQAPRGPDSAPPGPGPSTPDGYVPLADRLRETRPPDAQET